MRLKDAFLEMPVKKAAVLVVFAILLVMFVVQALFINQVFTIINRSVTRFEHMANEDKRELANDLREVDEEIAYNRARSAYEKDISNLPHDASPQVRGCHHMKIIERLEAMHNLPYVKQYKFAHDAVENHLFDSHEAVNMALERQQFDPMLCEKSA